MTSIISCWLIKINILLFYKFIEIMFVSQIRSQKYQIQCLSLIIKYKNRIFIIFSNFCILLFLYFIKSLKIDCLVSIDLKSMINQQLFIFFTFYKIWDLLVLIWNNKKIVEKQHFYFLKLSIRWSIFIFT